MLLSTWRPFSRPPRSWQREKSHTAAKEDKKRLKRITNPYVAAICEEFKYILVKSNSPEHFKPSNALRQKHIYIKTKERNAFQGRNVTVAMVWHNSYQPLTLLSSYPCFGSYFYLLMSWVFVDVPLDQNKIVWNVTNVMHLFVRNDRIELHLYLR